MPEGKSTFGRDKQMGVVLCSFPTNLFSVRYSGWVLRVDKGNLAKASLDLF